jgi:Skp family chaperone for outer membrane proteins
MKRISVITTTLILLAIAAVCAAAQTPPRATGTATPKPAAPQATAAQPAVVNAPVPDSKIAVVDTDAFRDEKAGIKRYLNAVSSVQREFQPRNAELLNLQNRIKALADEINKLSANTAVVGPETIQTKQQEGERLQRELKYKKEQADADFEKRYNEIVKPVTVDIGNALVAYASQHGLTMILDMSKMAPAVLAVNPATDITLAFIADYNAKHP